MNDNPRLWAQYYQALAQGDPGRARQILAMINKQPAAHPTQGIVRGTGCSSCRRRFR